MQYAQIKCDHGCSLCAWLLTSGGFQLSLRLRRNDTLALRARAPTKRTHLCKNLTNLKRGERAFALIRLQSARFFSRFVQVSSLFSQFR